MRVKYSFETRKLRVYHPDSTTPSFWQGVGIVKSAGRAWFLALRPDFEERLEEEISLLEAGPKSPYEVQEVSFLLRRLKQLQPALVLDLPGWRNPRENPRAEWLATLRQLDQQLAAKVREFICGEGKREYLKQDSRQ